MWDFDAFQNIDYLQFHDSTILAILDSSQKLFSVYLLKDTHLRTKQTFWSCKKYYKNVH